MYSCSIHTESSEKLYCKANILYCRVNEDRVMQINAWFPFSFSFLQSQIFFFCDKFVVCHFTGLKRWIENVSQYKAYFMRFLNTKKQLHRDGDYMDALCEPSEAFRLTGHLSILPVCPPQSAGCLFACVTFATAELWDTSSEEDHILEGFDPSALCRQLFPLHSDLFNSSKTQSLRFPSQVTLLQVSSPPMYVTRSSLTSGYSLLSFKLLSPSMGI